MKLTISKEWCETMAALEGDGEIGAGLLYPACMAGDHVYVVRGDPPWACTFCGYRWTPPIKPTSEPHD